MTGNENGLGQEIFRLMKIAREKAGDDLIREALGQREKTVSTITSLMSFITKHFGRDGSSTTEKFWMACQPFLEEAGLDDKQMEAIRRPRKVYGQTGFKSVLEEFET